MSFKLYKNDKGDIPPFEMRPCGSISVDVGTALVESSGVLAKATGTVKPTYISMSKQTVSVSGSEIPVIRISPSMIFETTLYDIDADIARGGLHTLHTDGAQITATTTGGVAEVVSFDGTAAGSAVRVRFN